MTVVVRVFQGLLVVAGLVACISAVIMAGIAHDDAGGRCYLVSVEGSATEKVPGPGCGTMAVYQVEAISAAAVGFAGIGVMIGAVAVGRMAPRAGRTPRAAVAAHGYGPPPGRHQAGPYQGPPTGQQPPVQPGHPYGPA
jgi:hypothetical protein